MSAACMALLVLLLVACSSEQEGAGITPGEADAAGQEIILTAAASDALYATTRSTTADEGTVLATQGDNHIFAAGQNVDLFIFEEAQAGHRDIIYDGSLHYLKTTAGDGTGSAGHGGLLFYGNAARTGAAVPKYWPASGNRLSFYGYHPAGILTGVGVTQITTASTTPVTVTIPADQGAADGSSAHNLMFGEPTYHPIDATAAANPVSRPDHVGKNGPAVNLNFTHCLSKIVVRIKGDGQTIGNGVTGPNTHYAQDGYSDSGEKRNGFNAESMDLFAAAAITLGAADMKNEYSLVLTSGTATASGGTVTYRVKNADCAKSTEDADGYQPYWCVIAPGQQLSGRKLTLRLGGAAEGSAYELTLPQIAASDYNAEAGRCYTYSVVVGLRDIRITGAVTDWTDQTPIAATADNTGLNQPLTITNTYSGQNTVTFVKNAVASGQVNYTLYSADGLRQVTGPINTGSNTITLAAGEYVTFTGNNAAYATGTSSGQYSSITCSQACTVSGNIMSLVHPSNYPTLTTLTGDFAFACLFRGNTGLTDASRLLLPAMTLTPQCYRVMFFGCTALTAAPVVLPAQTLAQECYRGMFYQCSSLTTIPEGLLPALTLALGCYHSMFQYCSALATTPELPATTLTTECYRSMFFGCTALTKAPALPALTLANNCYRDMFFNCSSLNEVHCNATDISATECTRTWLSGVSAAGKFYGKSAAGWTSGISGIPAGWTQYLE